MLIFDMKTLTLIAFNFLNSNASNKLAEDKIYLVKELQILAMLSSLAFLESID